MRNLFLFALLLLASCTTTSSNNKDNTTLDFWQLKGDVKSVKQRIYSTYEENGELRAAFYNDNSRNATYNQLFSVSPDINSEAYLYDLIFNKNGNLDSLKLYSNPYGPKLAIKTITNFNYDNQNRLAKKRMVNKNEREVIKSVYKYNSDNTFSIDKTYNEQKPPHVTTLLTPSEWGAKDVNINIIAREPMFYKIHNNYDNNNNCLKSEIFSNPNQVVLRMENSYNSDNLLDTEIASVYDETRGKYSVFTNSYKYNNDGNVTLINYKIPNQPNDTVIEYKYDDDNENYTELSAFRGSQRYLYKYKYDREGNWIQATSETIYNGKSEAKYIITREIKYY